MQAKAKGVQIFLTNEYDVTLKMLINNISNGNGFNWRIYYLDDIGNCSFFSNRKMGNPYSDEGYSISWNDLVKYSEIIEQLIFGVFIGSFKKDIKLMTPDKALYEEYEYYIEMVDGGMWIIFTKDQSFYDKLIAYYKCKIIESDFEDRLSNL